MMIVEEVKQESQVDSLLSELRQIERIAKKNEWTKEEEEHAKSRLINDWKDSEHERHHHMHLKRPS